jgi:hypothetical protein
MRPADELPAKAQAKMPPEEFAKLEAAYKQLQERNKSKSGKRTWYVDADGKVVATTELRHSVRPRTEADKQKYGIK